MKDVRGYEGKYAITKDGRVWSYPRAGSSKNGIWRKTSLVDGYQTVRLIRWPEGKTIKIHRLVAQAFIPNPNRLPEVNHIDGDKLNNHFTNLEWCTRKYNHKHSILNALNKTKLVASDIPKILALRDRGLTHQQIGKKFGVHRASISFVLSGRTWKHIRR